MTANAFSCGSFRVSDRHDTNPDYPAYREVGDKGTPLFVIEGSFKTGTDRYVNCKLQFWNEAAERMAESGRVEAGMYLNFVRGSIVEVQPYVKNDGEAGATLIINADEVSFPYDAERDGGEKKGQGRSGGKPNTRFSSGKNKSGGGRSGGKPASRGSSGGNRGASRGGGGRRFGGGGKPSPRETNEDEYDDE